MFLPSDFGFDARSERRDKVQLALLNYAACIEPRLVLKGGLAMRCAHSTARLTADVDFDADGSVSNRSIASTMRRSVQMALGANKLTPA